MLRTALLLTTVAIIAASPIGEVSASAQTSPATEEDATLAAAKRAAELAAERAKTADFRADEAEALARIPRAGLGGLTEEGAEGKVTVSSNAGAFEVALLANDALRAEADTVAERLCRTVPDAGCRGAAARGRAPAILVYADADGPRFVEYDLFVLQAGLIEDQLRAAVAAAGPARPASTGTAPTGGSIAAVATAADVLARLFRTDYAVAGVPVTVDQSVILREVVGRTKAMGHRSEFLAPALYSAANLQDRTNPVVQRLVALDASRASAEALHQTIAAGPKANALAAALTRYREFLTAQATPPQAGGPPPLLAAVQQATPAEKLRSGGLLLLVRTETAGGTTYTARNFWTAFGSLPFYASGGAITSFALFDGATGSMLDGYSLGRATPFTKVRDVGRR